MSVYDSRLRRLLALLPLAPRAVEAEAEALLEHPRLTFLQRARARSLLARARAFLPPEEEACCAFVVVGGGEGEGGVLHALALHRRRPSFGLLAEAFDGALAELEFAAGSAHLQLWPHPAMVGVELRGDSGGAAFALAFEAFRRGRAVAREVVVSAAVEADGKGGWRLLPVADCDRKRRILERERPGCRFFFVPLPGEEILPSSRISLHPLEPGPIGDLFEIALQGSARESLVERLAAAGAAFEGQRYDEAAQQYRAALEAIEEDAEGDEARWRLLALARLGAVELHAGRPADASRLFEQAEAHAKRHRRLGRGALDELRLHIAGERIDRFDPDQAAAITAPLEAFWRERWQDDPADSEFLVAALGVMRRVHLLRGDPSAAVRVQRELLEACPPHERARGFADLAECLRRAGRVEEAFEAAREGFDSLQWIPAESYRLQTAAFLTFYEGRLLLGSGGDPSALRLGLLDSLPPRSAARRRLERLDVWLRLRAGDEGAAALLIEQADAAPTPFARWLAAVGLLEAAAFGRASQRLRRGALRQFASLEGIAARHPPLEAARAAFVAAAGEDASAEATLLRLSAY